MTIYNSKNYTSPSYGYSGQLGQIKPFKTPLRVPDLAKIANHSDSSSNSSSSRNHVPVLSLLASSELPTYLITKYGRFNDVKKPDVGVVRNLEKH